MDNLIRYAPLLAQGAMVTIALAVLSLALATVTGAVVAAARVSGGAVVSRLGFGFAAILRGIPDLVLLLLIYFGGQRFLNQLGAVFGFGPVTLSAFWTGVLTLGLIYGAYLSETFRGAWMTVPRGQLEAARALGLGRVARLWKVIIPQLVRMALPGYANVWQVLAKSTAVVSVIGLNDVVGLADRAGKAVREPFLFFVVVLAVYLLITWVSTMIFERLEQRYALKTHAL